MHQFFDLPGGDSVSHQFRLKQLCIVMLQMCIFSLYVRSAPSTDIACLNHPYVDSLDVWRIILTQSQDEADLKPRAAPPTPSLASAFIYSVHPCAYNRNPAQAGPELCNGRSRLAQYIGAPC